MGIINKIRERAGLAVGLIALGLALFLVGGDILSPNSVLLRRRQQKVGEIAGVRISLERFQQVLDRMAQNYRINYGKSPDEEALYGLRDQAWQQLIQDIAYQEEYDALGLGISDEELVDMVQGDHVRPEVRRAFQNPDTRSFDPAVVQRYLADLPNLSPDRQALWYRFEADLRPIRINEKYNNLFVKSQYVTAEEQAFSHRFSQETRDIRYLMVPFEAVSDSGIEITRADLRRYLKGHRWVYKRDEEKRDMVFVSFDLTPTSKDTALLYEALYGLRASFAASTNDSLFALSHSEVSPSYQRYSPNEIPLHLADSLARLATGDLIGPIKTETGYRLYKLSAIEDNDDAFARASHILIKKDASSGSNAEKREQAENLLWQLKQGVDFSLMARLHSEDATSDKGGDLGWFGRGKMVKPFEKAVFGAKKTGLIKRVVETVFGYHLIRVDALPSTKRYAIASIEQAITPSEHTYATMYENARAFKESVQDSVSFVKEADKRNRYLEHVRQIKAEQRAAGTLSNARTLLRWLFHESNPNDISEIFELNNAFIVALNTAIHPAGNPSMDQIEQEVRMEVLKEKKAAIIKAQLKQIQAETLDEWASAYGNEAAIYQSSGLSWGLPTLTQIGKAQKVIGAAFAMQVNALSEPIEGENGVVIIELIHLNEAGKGNSDFTKKQIEAQRNGMIYGKLLPTLKKLKDVKDERHKFY